MCVEPIVMCILHENIFVPTKTVIENWIRIVELEQNTKHQKLASYSLITDFSLKRVSQNLNQPLFTVPTWQFVAVFASAVISKFYEGCMCVSAVGSVL